MDLELWELHLLSVVLSDFYLNGTLLMGMNIGCHPSPPSSPPFLPPGNCVWSKNQDLELL